MTDAPLPEGRQKWLAVRSMFDRIAPRYDLMNRLLTGGLDQRWRRRLLDLAGVGAGDRVVDVACGTGDLAEMARGRGAFVLGVDFAREMLRGAQARGAADGLICADAAQLPIVTAGAEVVTCGFALRNFVELEAVLHEMGRVLEPEGRLAILEVDRPDSEWFSRFHGFYFDRVVPRIGALLSDRAAYGYLPRSTAYLPPAEALFEMLRRAGFVEIHRERLLLGTAQLLLARRGDKALERAAPR